MYLFIKARRANSTDGELEFLTETRVIENAYPMNLEMLWFIVDDIFQNIPTGSNHNSSVAVVILMRTNAVVNWRISCDGNFIFNATAGFFDWMWISSVD